MSNLYLSLHVLNIDMDSGGDTPVPDRDSGGDTPVPGRERVDRASGLFVTIARHPRRH